MRRASAEGSSPETDTWPGHHRPSCASTYWRRRRLSGFTWPRRPAGQGRRPHDRGRRRCRIGTGALARAAPLLAAYRRSRETRLAPAARFPAWKADADAAACVRTRRERRSVRWVPRVWCDPLAGVSYSASRAARRLDHRRVGDASHPPPGPVRSAPGCGEGANVQKTPGNPPPISSLSAERAKRTEARGMRSG